MIFHAFYGNIIASFQRLSLQYFRKCSFPFFTNKLIFYIQAIKKVKGFSYDAYLKFSLIIFFYFFKKDYIIYISVIFL